MTFEKLDVAVAMLYAACLKTIKGAEYLPKEAITATAEDIVRWCRGGTSEGIRYSPEQQADWLVTEARETWPEWLGTAELKKLLLSKFNPAPKSSEQLEQKSLTPEDAIARGLIAPICEVCEGNLYTGAIPDLQYCKACPAGRYHAKWNGEAALDLINHPPAPRKFRPVLVEPLSYEQMQEALEDERRRKQKQLEELGLVDKPKKSEVS